MNVCSRKAKKTFHRRSNRGSRLASPNLLGRRRQTSRHEMTRSIFEAHAPSLAALLQDTTEDPLGTRAVLEDAYYKFSRILLGGLAAAGQGVDAFYRSFVPDRTCEHALPASGRARQALTSLRARRGDHIPRPRQGLTHAARTRGHSGRYHSGGRS